MSASKLVCITQSLNCALQYDQNAESQQILLGYGKWLLKQSIPLMTFASNASKS